MPVIDGDDNDNVLIETAGDDVIDGKGGNDTVDYTAASGPIIASLAALTATGDGTDSFTSIENLIGSAFGDDLTGDANDNVLEGGLGDDLLAGGGGLDTVSYAGAMIGVNVDLRRTDAQDTLGAGIDTLSGFGAAVGSSFNDRLVANTAGSTLQGGDGADILVSGVGADILDGGSGLDYVSYAQVGSAGHGVTVDLSIIGPQDTGAGGLDTLVSKFVGLLGSRFDDVLIGNDLDNDILGVEGVNIIDGGDGNDTVSFARSGVTGVTVDLNLQGVAQAVNASETDTLTNIENLSGGILDDRLIGDAGTNVLFGDAGNDILTGGGGDDTLDGWDDSDTAVFSGSRADYSVVIGASSITVTDLRGGSPDGTDTLTSIEALQFADGIQFSDAGGSVSYTANGAPDSTVTGGAGADTLTIDTSGIVLAPQGITVTPSADGKAILFDFDGDGITDLTVSAVEDIYLNGQHVVISGDLSDTGLSAQTVHYIGDGADDIFDASGLLSVEDVDANGMAGNDTLQGGPGDDLLTAGSGTDALFGNAGNDAFAFGADFDAADTIDGGSGFNDQVGIEGDYTGAKAIVLAPGQLIGVEVIAALPGGDYDITTANDHVAAGQSVAVYGSGLGVGDDFTVDGSAQSTTNLVTYGGLGADHVTGGSGNDGFYFGEGRFSNATDIVAGGAGANDQLGLDGDYTITLSAANISGIEVIVMIQNPVRPPNTYDITTTDSLVAAGATMVVYGVQVTNALTFNGSAETDGAFQVLSGHGGDTIATGDGDDWILGGDGADSISGGLGTDTFAYQNAAESSGTTYDTLVDFDRSTDLIDLPGVHDSYAGLFVGALSTATFDTDLAAAMAGVMTANGAVFFDPDSGTLSGSHFLIVDGDGVAGYTAGSDYVFELGIAPPHSPPFSDFII